MPDHSTPRQLSRLALSFGKSKWDEPETSRHTFDVLNKGEKRRERDGKLEAGLKSKDAK